MSALPHVETGSHVKAWEEKTTRENIRTRIETIFFVIYSL